MRTSRSMKALIFLSAAVLARIGALLRQRTEKLLQVAWDGNCSHSMYEL